MNYLISLLSVVLVCAVILFVYVMIAKIVYFAKRTRYIYKLRKKLKLQQQAAQKPTMQSKEGEKV